MLWWLAGVVICLALWAGLWKRNLSLAGGVLVGLLLAWFLSYLFGPTVAEMETIPIWLPPLPLATIAVALFVYGALVWFRGNDALPKGRKDEHSDGHH